MRTHLNHIDDVPDVMQSEATKFLQEQAQNLICHEFEWFREAGKQLEAFAEGRFRLTPTGGHYGDEKNVVIPIATNQMLRRLRTEHLPEHFLAGLKQDLKEMEEKIESVKKPGMATRLFSKPAREASRALNQFGWER